MGREGIRYDSENQTLDRYIILDNLTATTDPTVNDDQDAGYGITSFWVNNTAPKQMFICIDDTSGSADWLPVADGDSVIDYKNPTDANSTSTITPVAGQYFTSTSALITIKTSANERLLPSDYISTGTTDGTTASKLVDSGAAFDTDGTSVGDVVLNTTDSTRAKITAIDSSTTLSLDADIMVSGEDYEIWDSTRKIWGRGSGGAITLTVNTSSLNTGDRFEIQAENGESRILIWDGTDLVKVGGIELPMNFMAETDTLQDHTLESGWVNIDLEDEVYDTGSIFASHTFTPVRNAIWNFMTLLGIQADTGETLTRAASSIMESSVPTYVMTDTRPGSSIVDNPLRDTGVRPRKVIEGNGYRFGALARTSGGNNFEILGDSSAAKTTFAGEEVIEW